MVQQPNDILMTFMPLSIAHSRPWSSRAFVAPPPAQSKKRIA
jgi:hypothetical protein